ncbi:MAG: DNA topoisomerase IB [Sphingorhabdus sp.]
MVRLRYIDSFEGGYSRKRVKGGWQYFAANGRPVKSPAIIERLNALALPPAYTDAWYCPYPNGHIQAVGVDGRGRGQYRYHHDFIARKDAEKYGRCLNFAERLPAIRKRVERDIARRDISCDRVVAAVIRLLDMGRIRVGNAQYARANKSFGATTLRNRHASVRGSRVILDYLGKSGKQQRTSINDRRLSTIVKRCQDLPGQTLFQYVDSNDNLRPVTSGDINAYLKEHAGDFTAKDFRTWGASVIAFSALVRSKGKTTLKEVLHEVATELGNTPAMARKSYVHPAIIEAVQAGADPNFDGRLPRGTKYLSADERGLIEFLTSQRGG